MFAAYFTYRNLKGRINKTSSGIFAIITALLATSNARL
jgi:hypothetical protein